MPTHPAGREITLEALEAELPSLRKDNPELTLHLLADQDVPYRSVAKVMGGYPPGASGNPRPFGMPPFGSASTDDEIAAVFSY